MGILVWTRETLIVYAFEVLTTMFLLATSVNMANQLSKPTLCFHSAILKALYEGQDIQSRQTPLK